jgi:DNA-directed RNA polymerase specialized sigma24 family protein
VEGRFFGGLSWTESAESLGISEATVMREWRAARAWLACEMRRQSKLGTPAQLSKVGA